MAVLAADSYPLFINPGSTQGTSPNSKFNHECILMFDTPDKNCKRLLTHPGPLPIKTLKLCALSPVARVCYRTTAADEK